MSYDDVRKPSNRKKDIDTHELLKKELYMQTRLPMSLGGVVPSSTGAGGETESFLGTSEQYGLVDRFLYFDSNLKSSASIMSNGELVFDVQLLNQNKPLDNIIEMQIGDFFIPSIDKSADFPEYFFFKRVMVGIAELNAQAIFAENGNLRFHFELNATASGISHTLTDMGFSKFIFTQPIRDMAEATIQFHTPSFRSMRRIAFSEDTYNFTAVPLVAGGIFGGATITTTTPHGLTVGDDVSIFVTNFNSGIGNIDSNIGSPDYQDGHLVRVIDTTTLEFRASGVVGFDFLTLAVATPGELLIAMRRIAFTIRFRSLAPRITNQIIPV